MFINALSIALLTRKLPQAVEERLVKNYLTDDTISHLLEPIKAIAI